MAWGATNKPMFKGTDQDVDILKPPPFSESEQEAQVRKEINEVAASTASGPGLSIGFILIAVLVAMLLFKGGRR